MSELSLSLLGSFVASVDGRPLTYFRAKTTQALLIYLAYQPEAHTREQLMALLWPNVLYTSTQQNLRQCLYQLRHLVSVLPAKDGNGVVPFLLADRQRVQVNPDGRYDLDVHTFSHLLQQDESYWPEAVALYRGDFLADFYLPDSTPFEEWVNARRADLQRQILKALEKLTDLALTQIAFDTAEAYARRQIEIDNLRESAHRQLMEAMARHGRRTDALSHYKMLVQLLQTELGIAPSPETQALYETLQQNDLAAEVQSVIRSPRHNLPQSLTSFIGREKEIAHLQKLLLPSPNRQNRLVTLTGVGGTGKTRLSLEAARTLLDAFPDGIWLVELAPVADPTFVAAAIAAVFELRQEAQRPFANVLADYLQTKRLLLILDNCEHLIETCARLVESWLTSCLHLHMLVSSREALSIPGEILMRVPPLTVPDLQQTLSLETLQKVEAVQLFVERARAELPGFTLTMQNETAVARICQRLDGIPLALELAAARVKVLQVEQIARRLDARFHLLSGGRRTALPRQQTLQATIDWSYDLLTEAEQQLLQRLSVFVGGWTLEAAELVCADEQIGEHEILDLLTHLVNKSLVIADRVLGQEARYRLLETIRQYASDKLRQAGSEESWHHRHLEFFLQLAETAEPELRRVDQLHWLDRLDAENDNLHAALAWSSENAPETALRLVGALVWYWHMRGYWYEKADWLLKILALPQNQYASLPRLKALVLTAQTAFWQGDGLGVAHTCIAEGLPLARTLDDKVLLTFALCIAGLITIFDDNLADGKTLFDEALLACQELPDRWFYAFTLFYQGVVTYQYSELATGQVYLETAAENFLRAGDQLFLSYALNHLSTIALQQTDYRLAVLLTEETLIVHQKFRNKIHIAERTNDLGLIAYLQNDLNEAREQYEVALSQFRHIGFRKGIAYALAGLGEVALAGGEYERARRLLGESLAISQELDFRRFVAYLLILLGQVYLQQKEIEKAMSSYQASLWESLSLFRGINGRGRMIDGIEGIAGVWLAKEEGGRAATLFGAAAAHRTAMQRAREPAFQLGYERDITAVRAQLDDETFNIAWAAGQTLSLEEAIAYALEE